MRLTRSVAVLLACLWWQFAALGQPVQSHPLTQASPQPAVRPTLDATRLPLTTQPLATIRAGLTATALAATSAPSRTPTVTPPRLTPTVPPPRLTPTVPSPSLTSTVTPPRLTPTVTPPRLTPTVTPSRLTPMLTPTRPGVPNAGAPITEPNQWHLIWLGLLCCCAGAFLLRFGGAK